MKPYVKKNKDNSENALIVDYLTAFVAAENADAGEEIMRIDGFKADRHGRLPLLVRNDNGEYEDYGVELFMTKDNGKIELFALPGFADNEWTGMSSRGNLYHADSFEGTITLL